MDFFGRKKKKEEDKRKEEVKEIPQEKSVSELKTVTRTLEDRGRRFYDVLQSPRITEKATSLTADNVYVFNVRGDSNKREVREAVQALYGVHPIDVKMVRVPEKKVFVRGKIGTRAGGKKAYIKLREGETIELV